MYQRGCAGCATAPMALTEEVVQQLAASGWPLAELRQLAAAGWVYLPDERRLMPG